MVTMNVRDVTFSYDNGPTVIQSLSLSVAAGLSVLIIGDNGAGKSTLGRVLSGMLRPASGSVCIDGDNPAAESISRRAALVSYMGQVSQLSVLTEAVGSEIRSFMNGSSGVSAAIGKFDDWAVRHALPRDLAVNPRDLTAPDLWRLVLGLYVQVLRPRVLIVDEVVAPGAPRQLQALRSALSDRKAHGEITIVLYQRLISNCFDQEYSLVHGALV